MLAGIAAGKGVRQTVKVSRAPRDKTRVNTQSVHRRKCCTLLVTVTVEAYLAQLSANVGRHWLRHTLGLGDHTAQTRGHETRPGGLEARRTYVVQTLKRMNVWQPALEDLL